MAILLGLGQCFIILQVDLDEFRHVTGDLASSNQSI